ncbi:DEKNAAC102264 [Brettanomyces naardenensis]|uniref:DEKNAAC102264 n=1 Tax=Brettanomyces naardenensis TaxID=13370 RepID=A0A448YKB0_BRENA|nr:DEKNAAC102264 [Brettanomyces naardenensis]
MTTSRVALAPLSDAKLNINFAHNRAGPLKAYSKSLLVSNDEERYTSRHLTLKRSLSTGLTNREQQLLYNGVITPRQEKARILKMRLQLAYYKVKTNQTDVPLHKLRLPYTHKETAETKRDDDQPKSLDALSDLLAASSPLFKRTSIATAHRNSGTSTTHRKPKLIRSAARTRMLCGKLDDVVARRSSGHGHKFSLDSARVPSSYTQPLSAPAVSSRFSLTLPTPYPQHSFSNQTSPSRFAISKTGGGLAQGSLQTRRLPPAPGTASHVPLVTLSQVANSRPSFTSTAATAAPSHSVQDADATIIQNTSSMIATPVRNTNASRVNDKDSTIHQDDSQSQLSPRILSTPSSIGAARCLLQLAHR